MANHCPRCNHEIETNENYSCPKCGEKFWISKEKFEMILKLAKNNQTHDNKNVTEENKTHNKINYSKTAIYFLIMSIVLFVISGYFSDLPTDKHPNASAASLVFATMCAICLLLMFCMAIISAYKEKASLTNDQDGSIFCPQCKKQNENDAKYCIYCGEKISIENK